MVTKYVLEFVFQECWTKWRKVHSCINNTCKLEDHFAKPELSELKAYFCCSKGYANDDDVLESEFTELSDEVRVEFEEWVHEHGDDYFDRHNKHTDLTIRHAEKLQRFNHPVRLSYQDPNHEHLTA